MHSCYGLASIVCLLKSIGKEFSQYVHIWIRTWNILAHLPNPFVKSNVASATWDDAH